MLEIVMKINKENTNSNKSYEIVLIPLISMHGATGDFNRGRLMYKICTVMDIVRFD